MSRVSTCFKVLIVWLIPASRYSWRLWYYWKRKSCIICSNRCFNWYEIYVCVVLPIFWSTKSLWWSPWKGHSWFDDKVTFFSQAKAITNFEVLGINMTLILSKPSSKVSISSRCICWGERNAGQSESLFI